MSGNSGVKLTKFRKRTALKLTWLIRGIVFFCFLSGGLTSLIVVFFMDGDWYSVSALILGAVLALVLMWYANTSLNRVLEYEGKVIWFVMFVEKVLKPLKEKEDAEKNKSEINKKEV